MEVVRVHVETPSTRRTRQWASWEQVRAWMWTRVQMAEDGPGDPTHAGVVSLWTGHEEHTPADLLLDKQTWAPVWDATSMTMPTPPQSQVDVPLQEMQMRPQPPQLLPLTERLLHKRVPMCQKIIIGILLSPLKDPNQIFTIMIYFPLWMSVFKKKTTNKQMRNELHILQVLTACPASLL